MYKFNRIGASEAPETHPYVAEIALDPAEWTRFRNLVENAPEVVLLACDDRKPNLWVVRAGCASREVRRRLEDAW